MGKFTDTGLGALSEKLLTGLNEGMALVAATTIEY